MKELSCKKYTPSQWKTSEEEGFKFIKRILPNGWTAELQGGNDSTISDIFIFNEKSEFIFAIEIKQLPSAGGMQFVVDQDENGLFVSDNINPHVPSVLNVLNSVTSRAQKIALDSVTRPIVQDCLVANLIAKNVKFLLITNATNSYFKLLPVSNLFEEVNVNLNFPRPKKSGSRDFPKTLLAEAIIKIGQYFGMEDLSFYPHFEKPKKTMVNIPVANKLSGKQGIYLSEFLYLGTRISLDSDLHHTYELRKLSGKSHDEIKPTVIINLTKTRRKAKQSEKDAQGLLLDFK